MMTTIKYSYLDGDRGERTGTWEGLEEEAIDAARLDLSAAAVGDMWVWYADETDECYASTDAEMARYGAAILSERTEREHDVYSLWCGSAREATPEEAAVYHGDVEVAS